jgi:hypothetical protein
MSRKDCGRGATAKRNSSGRVRLAPVLEARSAPQGWSRPPKRPHSQCPICWSNLSHLAWADWCPQCRTTLRGGRTEIST